ncbi:RHS repeat protein [Cellulosilyticum sp. WCF-2]|nr:RHS repeat protein [Cellulosilyticum sp. WCF-2]
MTYPNGQNITYNYDGSELLTDTIDFNGGITHYDNNGRIKTITRPNGTTRTTTYDKASQVKTIICRTGGTC